LELAHCVEDENLAIAGVRDRKATVRQGYGINDTVQVVPTGFALTRQAHRRLSELIIGSLTNVHGELNDANRSAIRDIHIRHGAGV
jgi:hypothetical protein